MGLMGFMTKFPAHVARRTAVSGERTPCVRTPSSAAARTVSHTGAAGCGHGASHGQVARWAGGLQGSGGRPSAAWMVSTETIEAWVWIVPSSSYMGLDLVPRSRPAAASSCGPSAPFSARPFFHFRKTSTTAIATKITPAAMGRATMAPPPLDDSELSASSPPPAAVVSAAAVVVVAAAVVSAGAVGVVFAVLSSSQGGVFVQPSVSPTTWQTCKGTPSVGLSWPTRTSACSACARAGAGARAYAVRVVHTGSRDDPCAHTLVRTWTALHCCVGLSSLQ